MTREKTIKILKGKMDGHTDTSYEWAETLRMAIKALEQEPDWIPVSERLPEDGTYLVTVEDTPRIAMRSFSKDLNKIDEWDFPKHKCGWYDYDDEYEYWEDTSVIAWMPLPKPYEPQEIEEISEHNMKMWEEIFKAESEG